MEEPTHRPRAMAIAAFVVMALGGSAIAAAAEPAADYQQAAPAAAAKAAMDDRDIIIATVHLDGTANTQGDNKHPPEAYPTGTLPPGGGLQLTPPDETGAWRMRAFVFEPRQVVLFQGGPVKLTFVGVQGTSNRIAVDGVSDVIELKRGELKTVTIPGDKPGVIGFRSLDRLPSMQGSVVILPRH